MRAPKAPSYRLHKGSGQAIVQHRGKRFYLGVYGSEESQAKYRQFVAELMQAPTITPSVVADPERADVTIVEITVAYREWARGYYQWNGQQTKTLDRIWVATQAITDLYGRLPAREFGPLKLQALQNMLIGKNLSRNYINSLIGDMKRLFRWATANELLPVTIYQALSTVSGLKSGRSAARETAPVLPVDDQVVDATLPYLPSVIADMVRLQRLTSCRPGEVCQLRPCDIKTSVDPWEYRPEHHKTQHHGHQRVVFIGPRAQDVLRPYLLRESTACCFQPADSERKRLAEVHATRKTPLSCGNRPGTNRKAKPKKVPGERYDVRTYRRAVTRAVTIANRERLKADPEAKLLPNWHPNQLRHTAATEIRRQFGLEAAQVALGHAAANVTQIYAERNFGLAAQVAKAIG